MRRALPVFALVSLTPILTVRTAPLAGEEPPPPPRNVVLLIGDGMGIAQLMSARYQKGRLAVEDMKHMGVSLTHSVQHFVTDSSASATVLASGYLIVNGEVGVHADGTPVKLIVEYAEEQGLWTGIVATSRITHATPAAMVAHVKSRGSEDEIAAQIAASEVDVVLGGGWDKFLPLRKLKVNAEPGEPRVKTAGAPRGRSLLVSGRGLAGGRTELVAERPLLWDGKPYGTRKDSRDLVEEMKVRGYRFVRTSGELAVAASGPPGKLLGLFHSGAMPKASEGRSPSLSAMSLAALSILSQSPRGFFLMIEGSQIDWGSHSNDFDYAMLEAADFDTAIDTVLRFLRDRGIEKETLVVVTADHETGGLSLNPHPTLPFGFEAKWTTTGHTALPVPVFADGACAEQFGGIQTHEDLGRKLIRAVARRPVEFAYPAGGKSRPSDAPPSRRF
ncbi:MAG: alkaline phosphatase [Planctomycetes bacterium]|nr:alkaline phosphatase [Planctomycetota bacterium]